MKDFLCFLFILTLCWILGSLLYFFIINSDDGYKKTIKENYSLHLGDTVLINNNTYIIIDYDFINSNVKLDNGASLYIDEVQKYLKK